MFSIYLTYTELERVKNGAITLMTATSAVSFSSFWSRFCHLIDLIKAKIVGNLGPFLDPMNNFLAKVKDSVKSFKSE